MSSKRKLTGVQYLLDGFDDTSAYFGRTDEFPTIAEFLTALEHDYGDTKCLMYLDQADSVKEVYYRVRVCGQYFDKFDYHMEEYNSPGRGRFKVWVLYL